jgi:hypothetical protein
MAGWAKGNAPFSKPSLVDPGLAGRLNRLHLGSRHQDGGRLSAGTMGVSLR